MNSFQIIYKYGGVYTDTDSLRLDYHNPFISIFSNFLSVQPLGPVFQHSFVSLMSVPPHYIQNCIFRFPPSSQFLGYVLALVREHFILARINTMGVSVKYGPVFFTTAFVLFMTQRFVMQDCFSQVHFGDENIHVIDGNFLLEASGASVVVQVGLCAG